MGGGGGGGGGGAVLLRISSNHIVSAKHCRSVTDGLSRLLQGHVPRRRLRQIHARIFRVDAHQDDFVLTRLIGHYPSKLGLRVFRLLQFPGTFPFNAIIRVLAEEGLVSDAFAVFKEMKFASLLPNGLTFSFLLKACSRQVAGVNCVKQIHSEVVKSGFTCDPFVCNGLLAVYEKTVKDLISARQVFDEMPERNFISSWANLIAGYAKLGLPDDALKLFMAMMKENLQADSDTMVSVLSACSGLNLLQCENWVNLLTKFVKDFHQSDYVNIVLVYLYGKCRTIKKSREAFDQISEDEKRNVHSWNAMIGAYVRNGCVLEALSSFKSMIDDYGCDANHVTMVSVLSACAEMCDLRLGEWVHEYMRAKGRKGVLSSNVQLATSLIEMYSKCGSLDPAREVFDEIRKKDLVSYNAMIMGLAMNGEGEEALRLFSEMQASGLCPDSATFLGALCACSHSGLLHEGRKIFNEIIQNQNVAPRLEHYACYIDLLSRSGNIEEALSIVASMPFKPSNYVWGSLLAGCLQHNRLELSEAISSMLVRVDPENSAGYVMLSNSFAAEAQWRDVVKLRGVMKEKRVAKQPGCSWINIDGVMHEFVAGSSSFLHMDCMMELLLNEMRLPTTVAQTLD